MARFGQKHLTVAPKRVVKQEPDSIGVSGNLRMCCELLLTQKKTSGRSLLSPSILQLDIADFYSLSQPHPCFLLSLFLFTSVCCTRSSYER